jgi:hypothetical protein
METVEVPGARHGANAIGVQMLPVGGCLHADY